MPRPLKSLPRGWNLAPAYIPSGEFPPVEARPLTGDARTEAFGKLKDNQEFMELARALKDAGMEPRILSYELTEAG